MVQKFGVTPLEGEGVAEEEAPKEEVTEEMVVEEG